MVLRKFLPCLIFLLATRFIPAQQVNFSISGTSITTDDLLTITVKVEGGRQVSSPAFPGLQAFANVGTNTMTNWVNGKTSQSFSCNYMPRQAGTFQVPSFKIRVDGQEYPSPSWQVKVAKGAGKPKQQSGSAGGSTMPKDLEDFFRNPFFGKPQNLEYEEVEADYFLSVETNKNTSYPGEQLLGEVVLYINEQDYRIGKLRYDLRDVQMMASRVKNTGFWQEMLPSYSITGERVNVGGKPYVAISLFKTFLYPLEPGTIGFDKVYLDGQKLLVAKNARDVFGRAYTDYEPVKVYARKKEITVLPLPPTDLPHAGIAGEFSMTGALTQDSLQTGEVSELKLTLAGRGNVAMLQEPVLHFPDGLEVYDPVSSYETSISETEVRGVKTFTWSIMPTRPGDHSIGPAKLYFFNSNKLAYDSVVLPPFVMHAEGEDLVNARMKAQENDVFYLTAFADAQTILKRQKGNWESWLLSICLLTASGAGAYRFLVWRKRKPEAKGEDFKVLPVQDSFWES